MTLLMILFSSSRNFNLSFSNFLLIYSKVVKIYLEYYSLIGSILTIANVSGSGKDIGQGYVNFMRNSMDQIRSKVFYIHTLLFLLK